MSQNSAEVIVGVTGSIRSFPINTVIEYGANAAVPATAKEHGFTNEDGVTVTGSRSVTNILAWQNATQVRTVVTDASVTFQFTLYQSNADNAELFYGVRKNPVTGAYHWDPSRTGGLKSFMIDAKDTSRGKSVRYYVPQGEVTEVGEQQIQSSSVIAFNVTITAYKVVVEGEEANTLVWIEDDEA